MDGLTVVKGWFSVESPDYSSLGEILTMENSTNYEDDGEGNFAIYDDGIINFLENSSGKNYINRNIILKSFLFVLTVAANIFLLIVLEMHSSSSVKSSTTRCLTLRRLFETDGNTKGCFHSIQGMLKCFSLTVSPYAQPSVVSNSSGFFSTRSSSSSNVANSKRFLQRCFLVSMALANILSGFGIALRFSLPSLAVPYMCNEFLPAIFLKISNIQILYSLAGCSADQCVAVLWPLVHRFRTDVLARTYLLFTIFMWIAVVLLVCFEYILPIRVVENCIYDSPFKAGQLVMPWEYTSFRSYCSIILCHHNYVIEIIYFVIWGSIGVVILLCYIRLMIFLIIHRRQMSNMKSPKTGLSQEPSASFHNRASAVFKRTCSDNASPLATHFEESDDRNDCDVFGGDQATHNITNPCPFPAGSSFFSHESNSNKWCFISGLKNQTSTFSIRQSSPGSTRQPLKGVILTFCIIVTFSMVYLPRMIVEVMSSYYDNINCLGQVETMENVMKISEVLILIFGTVLPLIYGMNVWFLIRRPSQGVQIN